MKLIDIIGKVVLEEARDGEDVKTRKRIRDLGKPRREKEEPSRDTDRERDREEPKRDREEPKRDREEPKRDREEPRRDRDEPRRDREDLERVYRERRAREERERRAREERERRDSEERERRDSEERERRDRVRPRTTTRSVEEPPKTDDKEIERLGKSTKNITKTIKKEKDKTNLIKNPKFKTHDDIKNIKKVQTKEFLNKVEDKIEIQLKQQPAKVIQTLKKYNLDPKVMAKLAPLSKESFKTIMNLESNGVKLPLLILLFKNKNKLYNSMKTGKPLTKNDINPIGGGINYNQFWDWSNKLNKNWGKWLGDNVVKNFPEISAPTLSF